MNSNIFPLFFVVRFKKLKTKRKKRKVKKRKKMQYLALENFGKSFCSDNFAEEEGFIQMKHSGSGCGYIYFVTTRTFQFIDAEKLNGRVFKIDGTETGNVFKLATEHQEGNPLTLGVYRWVYCYDYKKILARLHKQYAHSHRHSNWYCNITYKDVDRIVKDIVNQNPTMNFSNLSNGMPNYYLHYYGTSSGADKTYLDNIYDLFKYLLYTPFSLFTPRSYLPPPLPPIRVNQQPQWIGIPKELDLKATSAAVAPLPPIIPKNATQIAFDPLRKASSTIGRTPPLFDRKARALDKPELERSFGMSDSDKEAFDKIIAKQEQEEIELIPKWCQETREIVKTNNKIAALLREDLQPSQEVETEAEAEEREIREAIDAEVEGELDLEAEIQAGKRELREAMNELI